MGANKVVQKSKEAKLKAAMAGGRSKKKKMEQGKSQGETPECSSLRQKHIRSHAQGNPQGKTYHSRCGERASEGQWLHGKASHPAPGIQGSGGIGWGQAPLAFDLHT